MEKEKEIQIVVSIIGVFFCQRYLFFVTHFSFRDKPLDSPLSLGGQVLPPLNPNPTQPKPRHSEHPQKARVYRVHRFLSLIK